MQNIERRGNIMKLGLQSAILAELSFEEVVDFAAEKGFSCIEMMCWPLGKADRRYAGVTHIDVTSLDDEKAAYIKNYIKQKNIEISLGYYPNPLDPDVEKSKVYVEHIKKMITAANKLGVKVVNSFIGRDKTKNVEENLKKFKEVWTPIIKLAEENDVKVAIENCPMLFTNDEWPGGNNLATTPEIWRRMFAEIPSDYFGLNYDPSHFIWQMMDYIRPIYEFKDKIFHVHIKDVKIFKHKLDNVGIMATPLEFSSPKLPGLGDVDWSKFVSALTDIRYNGFACIEVEDKAFEANLQDRKDSIALSKRFINQFIV